MNAVRSLAKICDDPCGADLDCPEVKLLEDGNLKVTGWTDDTHTTEADVIVPGRLLKALGASWT